MSRKFSSEYQAQAVGLVVDSGISVEAAAKELGIGLSTLDRWVRKVRGKQPVERVVVGTDELSQLKAENQRLRLERDLLKKAAVFSQPTALAKV